MLRHKLRRGIRLVREGKPLPRSERVGDEWLTHCQDTVLPIPPHPEDDEKLLEEVTDAVMEVVFAGDQFAGEERAGYIETELKKINQDPRFK
jgi:hypothetical protein